MKLVLKWRYWGVKQIVDYIVRSLLPSVRKFPNHISLYKYPVLLKIGRFNAVIFLCLSWVNTWIPNVFLGSMSWYKRWFFILFILVELMTITVWISFFCNTSVTLQLLNVNWPQKSVPQLSNFYRHTKKIQRHIYQV